ncbi:MAG: hypothetical protein IPH93_13720 [Saprospiraceae bacterium]|nr:hypothetical protein [Saprospiraceae bacterium]
MKVNYFHQYESNNYYHIYNHACGDKNLFIDHLDYLDFMAKFQKYFSYVFDIYAYCLMPNHFHFLVKVKVEDNIKGKIIKEPDSVAKENYLSGSSELNAFIEDQYRRFFSAYSIKYNKKHKTSGRLFLNRHKRIILNPEYRLKYMLCYIHHNPIHHKFRRKYGEWTYCSYQEYLASNENYISKLNDFGGLDYFKNS